MSASSNMARLVRVRVTEGEHGLLFAESPDLKGLLVAKHTIDELWEEVPQAIKNLYKASGVNVSVVMRAQDGDPDYYPWVALPPEALSMEAIGEQRAGH